MCIQIGAHLAQGDDFLIWKNKVGKKKVLFLSLEMGPNALHVIWQTIMAGYEDHQTLNRNFKVYPIGEPVPLDSEAGQRWLSDLMDEYKPDVLILDSLQKIVSKALTDEEAAKSLFNYISLIRAKYGCSVLIVHHNRKRSNDGQKKQDTDLSDVFGSTYITTDVDFVLSLQKQEEANTLKVALLKNRFGPDDKAFLISRDEHLHFHNELSELHENFDDDSAGFPFGLRG
jgi:RecA-family ATPase